VLVKQKSFLKAFVELFSTPHIEVFLTSHVVSHCVKRGLHERSLIKLAIHSGTLVTL